LGAATEEEIEALDLVDKSTRPMSEDNLPAVAEIPAKEGEIRALPGGEE
jgi:hypothetical protein